MSLLLGLLFEWAWGDPQRWHPVALFGRWAAWIESYGYGDATGRGLLAWLVVVLPPVMLLVALHAFFWHLSDWVGTVYDALLLWYSLGWRSLFAHVRAVLRASDEEARRSAVACIVSRDTAAMGRDDARRAALESLAENASDAVVAPLFWFLLAGPLGAAVYRMINTLDAMWGYRNDRFARFGTVAARIDDAVNWLPARITAALLVLAGRWPAWPMLQRQARSHASPNAGWPEAALAFAADVRLGGPVMRAGRCDESPWYGPAAARAPEDAACDDALRIVQSALITAALLTLAVHSV